MKNKLTRLIAISIILAGIGSQMLFTNVATAQTAPATDTLASDSLPTDGWREQPFTFTIHKAYNLNVEDRYSYNKVTNTHTFLLHHDDLPFKPDSKTSPRCELRMKNDYTSGMHQFEADYKVAYGSNHPIVMQIFGTDKPGFMLKVYDTLGGAFRQFDSKILDTEIFAKWKHINMVHNADNHTIKVYVNYVLKGQFKDKGAASHYFKCGLYTTRSDESKVEIRNIKYWIK